MKKLFSIVLSIMLMVMTCLPMVALADDAGADVVIVIDDTKSMQKNDPNKLTATAVEKYLDKVTSLHGVGRAGVVTFSDKVMSSINLQDVQVNTLNDDLKNFVKEKVKQQGSCTNIAVGIEKAVSMLDGSSAKKKAIIAVTDGEYDFSNKLSNSEKQNKVAKANENLNKQIQTAKDENIQIYTIKIENEGGDQTVNYDGKVDFDNIVETTNGAHYVAQNATAVDNDIAEITNSIYDFVGSIDDYSIESGTTTIDFTIPDGAILASIQVDFKDPSNPIQLKTVEYENGDEIKYKNQEREKYLDISCSSLKAGKARLVVYSEEKQTARISFTYASNISIQDMSVSSDKGDYNTGTTKSDIYVKCHVYDGESLISDDIANSMVSKTIVTDANGNVVKSEDGVVYGGEAGANFNIDQVGNYNVQVVISDADGNEIKSSEVVPLTIEKAKVSPILIILLILLLILIIVAILLILKKVNGSKPEPFGTFQYSYFNTNGEKETLLPWELPPYVNHKTRTVTVGDMMKTYHPDLAPLDAVVFSATGTKKAPTLQVANVSGGKIQVFLNSQQVTEIPTNVAIGDDLRIEYTDENTRNMITINAKRI